MQNPEVVEAAYEDGITLSYPYFTERQFKISLELLEKSWSSRCSSPTNK